MLPSENRLKRPEDFTRVVRRGARSARTHLVVHGAGRSGVEDPRVGLVVSKKIGNAVVRNRVKRRLREILRARRDRLRPGMDYVVRALPGAGEASSADLVPEVESALAAVHRSVDRPAGRRTRGGRT